VADYEYQTTDTDGYSDQSDILDRVLTQGEREDLDEADSTSVEVTFATQDYPIDALVSRVNAGAILIPRFGHNDDRIRTEGFQRGFVWTQGQMDRFIESLLLGYPIPGIFLIRQSDNRLLVLDGQQRLLTLTAFYKGVRNSVEFRLKNVGDVFKGLTFESLSSEFRRRLDDSYMQATIVDHDGSNDSAEAIYKIFERLNSGGTQLTPHEIRIALVAGDIVSLLSQLNANTDWRAIYGRESARLRDQELVLRILALFTSADKYKRPLKTYLNEFAITYREDAESRLSTAIEPFSRAVKLLNEGMGSRALRGANNRSVNVAQAEAIVVGVMRALSDGRSLRPERVREGVNALLENSGFVNATQKATADLDSVRTRLSEATKEFSRR